MDVMCLLLELFQALSQILMVLLKVRGMKDLILSHENLIL